VSHLPVARRLARALVALRSDRGPVRDRRLGVRPHRSGSGRCGPQRGELGRGGRDAADTPHHPRRMAVVGVRLRRVPVLRCGQAAADPLHRPHRERGRGRDVRRRRRGVLHAAARRGGEAVLLLMARDALLPLARRLGARLKKRRLRLATAESCTGGWIAQAVTAIAGSSDWFERGFVTYSNEAKQEMLGVKRATLKKHGAVSEETAREMAKGALKKSRATIAVAVTGVA